MRTRMCNFPWLKPDFTAFFNEAENEGALFAEGYSGGLASAQERILFVYMQWVTLLILQVSTLS